MGELFNRCCGRLFGSLRYTSQPLSIRVNETTPVGERIEVELYNLTGVLEKVSDSKWLLLLELGKSSRPVAYALITTSHFGFQNWEVEWCADQMTMTLLRLTLKE